MSKPQKEKVKILFEDMTFGSTYTFLEQGKDDDELKAVGEKIGMELPSPDIAVFKGLYAMVDEENRNKCTLPREEVETALTTLRGKAVDVDHLRKNTVGFWIDAHLEGDSIISYGAFWKSNFEEEYDDFKSKMVDGGVAISMEAWGERVFTEGNSYELHNIHFAGGALLDEEKPACPGAGVLEFSKTPKNRVLEFAKVLDKGTVERDEKWKEEARISIYDLEYILDALYQIENPNTKKLGYWQLDMIDFANNKVVAHDVDDNTVIEVDFTPRVKEKARQVLNIKVKDNAKSDTKKKPNVGGKTIMTDQEIKNLMEELASLKAKFTDLEKSNAEKDATVASLKEELTKAQEVLKAKIEEFDKVAKELDEAKAKIKEAEDAKAKEVEEANKKTIEERKNELGDLASDMSDEDLLDDDKYEVAKLKKQNAELIEANQKGIKVDVEMAAGRKDEDNVPGTIKLQKKIHSTAWND